MAGDLPDIAVLKHLEPGTQADDNAAPDALSGLLEDAIGRFGRVADWDIIKQSVQLLLTAHGQQLVDLSDVLFFIRIAPLHIEDQCFQQIHLGVVPEVVSFSTACILDDNVTEKLRHQLLPVDLRQTVPGVRTGGCDQIEHLHRVALVPEVLAGFFVEF